MSALRQLRDAGQAVWLDYIRRDLLTEGELRRLVNNGVTGVTSNPAIFQQAIGESDLYDRDLVELLEAAPDSGAMDLYEQVALADIRLAADVLRPVFDESGGADGFVSLEVSPHLAHDTDGTVDEARRLWEAVDRPNLMIKVPATAEGIPAIEGLLAAGIHVNVTLMFSQADYEAVAQAYLRGVAAAARPESAASVASFFVSRVDSKVDPLLEAAGPGAAELVGTIGIANCKRVYRRFQEIFHGPSFAELRAAGARPQRVLWASTSTKNPAYRDVLYVEELIGPQTVNTIPPATLDAFRDHGRVRSSLSEDVDGAIARLEALTSFGVDLDAVTAELQREGVEAFVRPFELLLRTLEEKRAALAAA